MTEDQELMAKLVALVKAYDPKPSRLMMPIPLIPEQLAALEVAVTIAYEDDGASDWDTGKKERERHAVKAMQRLRGEPLKVWLLFTADLDVNPSMAKVAGWNYHSTYHNHEDAIAGAHKLVPAPNQLKSSQDPTEPGVILLYHFNENEADQVAWAEEPSFYIQETTVL